MSICPRSSGLKSWPLEARIGAMMGSHLGFNRFVFCLWIALRSPQPPAVDETHAPLVLLIQEQFVVMPCWQTPTKLTERE